MLSISKVQTDVPVLMCTSKQPPVATFGCLDQESDHELVLNNAFGTLIERLRAVLGQSKGLASDDIDIGHIKQIMEEYQSDESEWGKFALGDATKGYTRNGVVNINGNANLLILVWSPGKGSAIHDHANAHCCMKILKGELLESLYDVPESEGHEMVPRKVTVMTQNEVGYISDKIGLHKISNASNKDFAVSLHLYTPPYASLYGCSMYESRTAVKHHVNMSKYYSWQGQLVNAKEASTC
ncbi:CIC11C00000001452 [Sungouiella intermedia]|uniref:Cysteine dioxygenase n=1 Tax=Sungouiella intermedia TaxID=45354 RepID=A0A1L0DHB9_9ASCO|nr:CIC11C00000001452 [[Candida] intermedia]